MDEQTKAALNSYLENNAPELKTEKVEPAEKEGENKTEEGNTNPASEETKALRDEISSLKAMIAQQGQVKTQEEVKPDPVQIPAFLSPEDLEGLVGEDGKISVEAFIGVFQKAGANIFTEARQAALRDLPSIADQTITRQTAVAAAASQFWQNNSDLFPFKEELRSKINIIGDRNPNLTLPQLFEQAGKELRQSLAAFSKAEEVVDGGTDFNHVSGGTGAVPSKDSPITQKEKLRKFLNYER
jgi:hypothetical protein